MAFPQVSPSVQALPSSHATVLFTWTQASTSVGAVSLQESPVQTLPSSQSSAAASHAPLSGLQISMPLQKLPSPGHSTVSPVHSAAHVAGARVAGEAPGLPAERVLRYSALPP
jgi:hypothetical protein